MTDAENGWARLAEAVRERRREVGIRRAKDLAVTMGVSPRLVGEIENARRTSYSNDTIRALEDALQWLAGSVASVVAGNSPTPMTSESTLPRNISFTTDMAGMMTNYSTTTAYEEDSGRRAVLVMMARRFGDDVARMEVRFHGATTDESVAQERFAYMVTELDVAHGRDAFRMKSEFMEQEGAPAWSGDQSPEDEPAEHANRNRQEGAPSDAGTASAQKSDPGDTPTAPPAEDDTGGTVTEFPQVQRRAARRSTLKPRGDTPGGGEENQDSGGFTE